jgi:hypothetical protein
VQARLLLSSSLVSDPICQMRCLRLHPAAPGLRLSISTILVCVVPNLAMLRNITIDDEAGDSISGFLPGYSPVNGWTQGASCTGCAAQPDPIRAFNGTWHDATHHPGDASDRVVSLQFTGESYFRPYKFTRAHLPMNEQEPRYTHFSSFRILSLKGSLPLSISRSTSMVNTRANFSTNLRAKGATCTM